MPYFIVHLHRDEFFDVPVECDNEDDAIDLAVNLAATNPARYRDTKSIGYLEPADLDEPVEPA